jgi:hypothetical protein
VSIDAIVHAVEYPGDGTAVLRLRDPSPTRCCGQSSLTVVNPPPGSLLDAAIGEHLWGNDRAIMIKNRQWAERIGYVRIRLLPA